LDNNTQQRFLIGTTFVEPKREESAAERDERFGRNNTRKAELLEYMHQRWGWVGNAALTFNWDEEAAKLRDGYPDAEIVLLGGQTDE
jgi:hypothetical protein